VISLNKIDSQVQDPNRRETYKFLLLYNLFQLLYRYAGEPKG